MADKVKIFIVDDHEIFREGLRVFINSTDYAEVVGEADCGEEFINLVESLNCDIVFMDIQMSGITGIEATIRSLEKCPNLKIVALSMFGEERYLEAMLDAGAKGFILKKIKKNELELAIKLIHSGRSYYSEELLEFFTNKYIGKSKSSETETKITKRELEVLKLVSQGFTSVEVANKLCISFRTVEGHKANLIEKTGSKNVVDLLMYAIKNNLIALS